MKILWICWNISMQTKETFPRKMIFLRHVSNSVQVFVDLLWIFPWLSSIFPITLSTLLHLYQPMLMLECNSSNCTSQSKLNSDDLSLFRLMIFLQQFASKHAWFRMWIFVAVLSRSLVKNDCQCVRWDLAYSIHRNKSEDVWISGSVG